MYAMWTNFLCSFSCLNEHARSFAYVNKKKIGGTVMQVIGGHMPMYMMVYTRIRIRPSNGIVSCANQYS